MSFRKWIKRQMTRRHKKQKQKQKQKKTRRNAKLKVLPPSSVNNYSLPPSPGSPNVSPNTPITRRARELASLYPNQRTMIARSTSFNDQGMSTENFYKEFERQFPNRNGPAYV